MDCIISAGGIPEEEDLLYEYTQGRPKALLDMAGKPMVQWVVDALTGAKSIDHIILIGLRPEDGITSPKLTDVLPDQGSLVGNMVAGAERALEYNPGAYHVVMATADIPTITAEMVDGLIAQCTDPTVDVYYTVVERSLMEARFPNSKRSYVHLTDGDLAGGDIHIGNPKLAQTQRELAEELLKNRKSALKQIRKIGFGLFVKLLLRRLSLREAEERISKSLNLKGKAVLARHAELGMDVDKPFQLEICRQALLPRDK
ncbi:MAG: NTP transferase domain-containing protein [Anaerolineae bacterium]|jgi:GTP:adenosylcobinamide-phosphate guanylyltransferase|nr:NTP transferase domain-containing protein [Anaerolineae bacterium]